MTVNNLSNISIDQLLDCFFLAFENYYVEMPTDKKYYINRWKAAKVDFNLSYGMFDKNKLIGFIIHAIDKRNGILTAFNTGTGVIPEYRGRRVVKSIYEYALGDLLKNGVKISILEVITKNDKAIRSYESVGFKVCKKYKCYAGEINSERIEQLELKKIDLENIDWNELPNQHFYSWDFQKETILKGNNAFFQVLNNNEPESFFIINLDNHYLAQFDILNNENRGWGQLFSAIRKVSKIIKIINVDERLENKIININKFGLKNTLDQFEMELKING